ncbi:MAG: O-antigen ligase family protein [Planctomycetes bacterium]|nr:O-antigen ligase family protein [Planctomycetota bacterium]
MGKPLEKPAARSRPGSKTSTPDSVGLRQLWQVVWSGAVVSIFFARFFLPAESASQGDTLWVAGLWMLCAVAWGLGNWRATDRIRGDWLDGAVALWIGGQVVSAGVVILTTGDKRSAANQAWEWVATGVVWLILRHGFLADARRNALLRGLIVTGAVLGGFGLYQHYVSHPRLVAEYGPLFDRYRTATGPEMAAVAQKLAQAGIPTEGPGLVLFEKRLRDSREPMGLFALANTFGGCLAVFLLLTLAQILAARKYGSGWQILVPLVLTAGLLGWCLLLTKSRTAWVGTACGLLVLLLDQIRIATSFRRFLWPAFWSMMLIVVGSGLVLSLGGLDQQVLSEAPKSLAYRLQYWQATSHLIADHPWLGVGPGNFRQHYLKYKLPEASEEIADPHNLFFEVAATGGLFSALGLAAFLTLAFVLTRCPVESELVAASENPKNEFSVPTYWAASVAPLLAFLGTLYCWGQWDDQLLVFAVVWAAVAWVFFPSRRDGLRMATSAIDSSRAARAAAIALTIHLLGAGGIAYPAVCQLLLALLVLSLRPPVPEPSVASRWSWQRPLIGLANLVLLIGLVLTGLIPVLRCRGLLEAGDLAVLTPGTPGRAVAQLYQQAGRADEWSPDPWRHQFEAANRGIQSNESFDNAVKDLAEVIRRDPYNFWPPQTLGAVWNRKWQGSKQPADLDQAVAWFRRAHELYPTNSIITADLALALESAGAATEAKRKAKQALTQDDLNHQKGHVDRYLPESLRIPLETLAAP